MKNKQLDVKRKNLNELNTKLGIINFLGTRLFSML